MKRILILADINSSHTQKWAVSLAARGFQIGVFSLTKTKSGWHKEFPSIQIFESEFSVASYSAIFKIGYLKSLSYLKRVIVQFQPEIVHAHYATSYGMLGVLSGFHPFFITCWGSDIMDFPNKTFVHRYLIKWILKKADAVFASSKILSAHVEQLTGKKAEVIPFGIDLEKFYPHKVKSIFEEGSLVLGTIKSLEKIYCIDILIKAFHLIFQKFPNLPLKLLIVGDGTLRNEIHALSNQLNVQDKVIFTGRIDFEKISGYHNMIDIFVNISENESFGVAVLEASACEKPVVATKVGGLTEVVEQDVTGLLIPPKDVKATAGALEKLILDKNLRGRLGKNGRLKVEKEFNWQHNVRQMTDIYQKSAKK